MNKKNQLIYPQWMDTIVELGTPPRRSLSRISRDMGVTFAYFLKVINDLEDAGLIISNRYGRLRLTDLTEKGKDVMDFILQIRMRVR